MAFRGLTKDTFFLAWTSFFADISTEMLYPVLPIFLTQTLGASASIVGLIEGIATATQNIVQAFSGYLADRLNNRKYIALFGYGLAAVSKPFMGLSLVWQQVLLGRFSDRFGTGMRSAPRDALIASSTTDEYRGKAFGLEGIGDNAGAFLGPLIALLLLFFLKEDIRSIFYIALIPGLIAFLMVVFVKEKKAVHTHTLPISLKNFPTAYWKYIGITILFGFGNISSSFLILATKTKGIPFLITIAIYACFNLVAAVISYPAGTFSDKIGRKFILLIGFLIALVTFLGFALNTNVYIIGMLFVLYGFFQGIFRSVGKAYATDFTTPQLRASGVGWYATAVGLSGLCASIVGGQLWTLIGPQATFFFASFFVCLGSIGLLFLM